MENLQSKILSLESELSAALERVKELEGRTPSPVIQVARNNIERLESDNKALRESLCDSQRRVKELETAIESWKKDELINIDIQKENAKLRDVNEELRAEIRGLSPIEFFYLMYPNPTDDDGPLSY